MKRPLSSIRPIGPFSQIREADPDPEGSMVIVRLDVSDVDEQRGKLDSDFKQNMINVLSDAVAEATQPFSGAQGAIPINFDEAVMFQVFPVSVGQEFQKAILAMMYDSNLIGQEPDIEENIRIRTDRVERFDVVPL